MTSSVDAQNLLATAKRIFERHLNATIMEYEKKGDAVNRELEDLKLLLSKLVRGSRKIA